jgi:hypothetical protein
LLDWYGFMTFSFFGLRYNGEAIAPGAQTERRGEAGPVRVCLAADTHRPLLLLDDPIPISASEPLPLAASALLGFTTAA